MSVMSWNATLQSDVMYTCPLQCTLTLNDAPNPRAGGVFFQKQKKKQKTMQYTTKENESRVNPREGMLSVRRGTRLRD